MSSNNQSREHHYVPKFHLGHFTDTCNRVGRIWVHDKQSRRHEQRSPKPRGRWRDFYSIYLEGNEVSLEVDDFFTQQENRVAPIIKRLIHNQSITSEQFRSLLEFIFMLLVRSPRMRMADTLAVFHQLIDPIPVGGSTAVPHALHNWQVNTLRFYTNILPQIVDWLATIRWTLMTVTSTDGNFITTDNPVIFHCSFTDESVNLFVPLSPDTVLYTSFNEDTGSEIFDRQSGTRNDVVNINRLMLEQSKRYIFSREEDFCWSITNSIIGNRQDFLDKWERLAISQGH